MRSSGFAITYWESGQVMAFSCRCQICLAGRYKKNLLRWNSLMCQTSWDLLLLLIEHAARIESFVKQALLTALSLAMLVGGVASVEAASEWVEDDHTVFQAQPRQAEAPQPAPDRHLAQKPAASGFLTGSASMYKKPVNMSAPTGRTLSPRYAQQQANLGANTDAYIAGVRKDNVVSPEMMKGWLDGTHPEFKLSAQSDPSAVIEVRGAWDKADQILTAMGVRHHTIKSKELLDISLSNTKVLVVNCEGKIPTEAMEKVRQWVVRGGYLISTDWTLHSFVEKAFPGTIAWNGGNTPGTVVDAVIVDNDPVLLKGVAVSRAPWKLDEESQMVKILRPDIVHILACSRRLGTMDYNRHSTSDPNQWGILACEFPYGRGRVLHLVGHYDYNSPLTFTRYILPDAIPGAGIGLRQAISTNFLLEGLSRPERTATSPD